MKATLFHKTERSRIKMALHLDMEKMCERVVIAEESQIHAVIRKEADAVAILDKERNLGALLLDNDSENTADWNQAAVFPLTTFLERPKRRGEFEKEIQTFLEEKSNSENVLSRFAALKCCELYHRCASVRVREDAAQRFASGMLDLTRSFRNKLFEYRTEYPIGKILENVDIMLKYSGNNADTQPVIRIYGESPAAEWIVLDESIYVALRYYLQKMHENKICMRICRVCGRAFFASSKRFSLCSEECKRLKNRKNKQKFDERARENGYDLDYKNVTQRMRHRKNRLFLREDIPEAAKQEVEAQFESFRKEALRMKKTVEDKASYRAFNNWLFDHERLFYDLCEKTEKES